jgi:small subunit ribosomal protein S6
MSPRFADLLEMAGDASRGPEENAMVKYESIFIADPASTDEEMAVLLKGFEEAVTAGEGKVLKVERWGKRRLAYRVGKHEDGNYTLLYLECPPAAARELERRYRMNDRVIKYLTVRMDRVVPEETPAEAPSDSGERPAAATETE